MQSMMAVLTFSIRDSAERCPREGVSIAAHGTSHRGSKIDISSLKRLNWLRDSPLRSPHLTQHSTVLICNELNLCLLALVASFGAINQTYNDHEMHQCPYSALYSAFRLALHLLIASKGIMLYEYHLLFLSPTVISS